jgi:aminopeptidase N
MDYDTAAGKRRTLATNFEPAGARMLMPCWDEPGIKATFSMAIDAPANRMALSNMPVAATTPLPDGRRQVRFATTPKMSTYLLFVAVGDYERVHREVDGTDVGVVVKRGDLPRAAYALEQAAALLHWYNDWFSVRYPLPKLDLIAAPGQITGGSMENWGSIFYGQEHLLFDPKTSPEVDRQLVFEVVAHEMAHQWFGDLVTMAWWDELWLNEGFARWMQTRAADALHPEWRTGLQAQGVFERGRNFDATPASHPVLQPVLSAEQATQAFDSITYDKGAAVIAMLEAYIGADGFRDGVRRYMRAHAYGNTTDDDLWREMPVVAGRPVLDVEHDFTRQAGLPLIRVSTAGTGSLLDEDRMFSEGARAGATAPTWRMPLMLKAGQAPAELLMLRGRATVAGAPLINAGALAYARVLYPPEQAAALATRMGSLADVDRLNLINDAAALGTAGYAPASQALAYAAGLPVDADPIVWRRAVTLLATLDAAHQPGDDRARFRRWALNLLAPLATRTGMTERVGEDANIGELRSDLLVLMAQLGDNRVLAWARATDAARTGTASDRQTARTVVALRADAASFDAMLARVRAERDPLEKGRLLRPMTLVADPALASRFATFVLGGGAPAGSTGGLLLAAGRNNPDAVWTTLAAHLNDPALPLSFEEQLYVVPGIASGSSRPERMAQLRTWADKHLPADTRQDEQAAEATIRQNAKFQTSVVPDVDRWVDRRSAPELGH